MDKETKKCRVCNNKFESYRGKTCCAMCEPHYVTLKVRYNKRNHELRKLGKEIYTDEYVISEVLKEVNQFKEMLKED